MHALALLTLILSAADHWTTYLCLRTAVPGWQVSEGNPLAAWLFDSYGLVGGLAIDSVVTLLAVGFLLHTQLMPRPLKALSLGLLITTTGYAVVNNLGAVQSLGLPLVGQG